MRFLLDGPPQGLSWAAEEPSVERHRRCRHTAKMRGLSRFLPFAVLAIAPCCGKVATEGDEVSRARPGEQAESDPAIDLGFCREVFADLDQEALESACEQRCQEEASRFEYCAGIVARDCVRTCSERLTNADEECASCILETMRGGGFEDDSDCTCCAANVSVPRASQCEPGCATTKTCRAIIRESHVPLDAVGPQPIFETNVTFPLEAIYELTQSPSGLALAGYDEADDAAVVFATREGEVKAQYNVEAAARAVLLPQLESGGHWMTSSTGVWTSENEQPPMLRQGLSSARWKLSPGRDLALAVAEGQLWLVDTETWASNAYMLPEGLDAAVSVVWAGADEFLFNGSTENYELELTRARLIGGDLSVDWKREYADFNGSSKSEFFESDTGGGAYRLTGSVLTRFGATGEQVWSTPVHGTRAMVSGSGAVYVAGTEGHPHFAPEEQVDPPEGCSVYGCAAASLEKYNVAGSLEWHSIRRQEPSDVLVFGLIPEPALIVETFDGMEFSTQLLVFDL